jgi:hypothetical protein
MINPSISACVSSILKLDTEQGEGEGEDEEEEETGNETVTRNLSPRSCSPLGKGASMSPSERLLKPFLRALLSILREGGGVEGRDFTEGDNMPSSLIATTFGGKGQGSGKQKKQKKKKWGTFPFDPDACTSVGKEEHLQVRRREGNAGWR